MSGMYEVPLEVLEELREWRRHGVRITEKCTACWGSGVIGVFVHTDSGTGEHLGDQDIPCDTCEGTGKDYRENVTFTKPDMNWPTSEERGVVFPSSWLP